MVGSQQGLGATQQGGFSTSTCPALARSTASVASVEALSWSKSRVSLVTAAMMDEYVDVAAVARTKGSTGMSWFCT